jgi:hypothetical protein
MSFGSGVTLLLSLLAGRREVVVVVGGELLFAARTTTYKRPYCGQLERISWTDSRPTLGLSRVDA